jgi:hypothetical protein
MSSEDFFVEVSDEPVHAEIFQNNKFRIYVATIPPGQMTLFHRHSHDTVYAVLEGGMIKNENHGDQKKNHVVFSKTTGLLKMMTMGLCKLFTGYVKFQDHLIFIMQNKNRPVIHRAIASPKNPCNMRLMGIEVYGNPDAKKQTAFQGKSVTHEFASDHFSVFSLALSRNESYRIGMPGRSFCILCLKGEASIVPPEGNDGMDTGTIGENEFMIFNDILTVRNRSKKILKMTVIMN